MATVDVVMATHRLLSPETRFARLGLVVLDEEQRFGVEHKEYLKRLRTEVDVLAMSATPIPRTLEMGVAGIREMSTILTPPRTRHPVLTLVGPYDEKQIAAAIRREMPPLTARRSSCTTVRSIGKVRGPGPPSWCPEARVVVCALADETSTRWNVIMGRSSTASTTWLVSTTIVESAARHPERQHAHRGPGRRLRAGPAPPAARPGRAGHRARLRLLPVPPRAGADRDAHERLANHRPAHRDGRGHVRGVKDLEIRGAGNLLGGEQSGHIAGVGFDLYVRMIGEPVTSCATRAAERPEFRVELPGQTPNIPHEYVPGERLRLGPTRGSPPSIPTPTSPRVHAELTDRYGPPPSRC